MSVNFAPLKKWVACILIDLREFFIYILNTSALSDTWFAHTFLHSVAFHFPNSIFQREVFNSDKFNL